MRYLLDMQVGMLHRRLDLETHGSEERRGLGVVMGAQDTLHVLSS